MVRQMTRRWQWGRDPAGHIWLLLAEPRTLWAVNKLQRVAGSCAELPGVWACLCPVKGFTWPFFPPPPPGVGAVRQ